MSFVGQIELMRTTFSGLGVAVGLAIMVVFMIMATQFKSLRLPLVMLFAIPVSLVGIVLALLAAGQGFSIVALMGVLMVIG
ncbi:MAG: efflux RND transporter permease subunit, partial [Myxococcales bacterium]|nr:efflux RND transporter permease subunit [Myxococcales bacterium]